MKIQTVKIQGQGYLLNGTMSVPGNADGNIEYELIKQWLSKGNIPEPEFTDAELDAKRIQAIKSKASELITSKYPDYKQLNIMRTGGAELETMSAYIDSIRKISNKAEQDITKVEDVQWLIVLSGTTNDITVNDITVNGVV